MSYDVQVVYIYIVLRIHIYINIWVDDEKEYDPDNLISQIRNFCYMFFVGGEVKAFLY